MPANVRALIVVLILSSITFVAARPVALIFSDNADFARRRNVWFGLTVLGFLSPSFWLFVLFAAPVLVWAGLKDSNPVALCLVLLHVIPPISVDIPVIGVNKLFALDMYRLLSLCVLLPLVWRLRRSKAEARPRGFKSMDILLLGFGALEIFLFVRPDTADATALRDSFTNMLRRALLFGMDAYLLYYGVRRCCFSRRRLVEAMAAFCLISVVMAPIAIFETGRHWLLYKEMGQGWGGGTGIVNNYLIRAGAVRATVSSGDSLALGFLFAIALGFWLYLQRQVASQAYKWVVTLLLVLGLVAAYSRGPWAGAIVVYFVYSALGPKAMSRLLRAALIGAVLFGALLLSPLGGRIEKVVPFLGGQVDYYNIEYREALAERSLQMIRAHPLLGDQDAYAKLQDMRQGVGVIDFVNTYADIAVFYGLLGLFFFVGFILWGCYRVFRFAKKAQHVDPDLSLLGISLVACIASTLVMLYTSSFIFGYTELYYVLGGFAGAYSSLELARRSAIESRGQHPVPAVYGGRRGPRGAVVSR